MCSIYAESKQYDQLMALLKACGDFFAVIPKAKTAKIVRTMLDNVGNIDSQQNVEVQIALCNDVITWCKLEKRNFLRQRVESKIAILLLAQKNTQEALTIINSLLRELKKLGKNHYFGTY